MIRLWLSRGTAISIQEQLSAQFILGILSRRLAPGERLPSVRELARRLDLHANTISAVYQDLARRGWISRRRGSGVFVRSLEGLKDAGRLDTFVRSCIDEGLARGFSLEALRRSFQELTQESKQELLVVDSDVHLARVLAAEIGEAIGCVVPFASCDEAPKVLTNPTCVLVTESLARHVPPWLETVNRRTIRLNSMQDVLVGHQRPTTPVLLAVVSRSESVLRWAGTLLSALGFSSDAVLLRNPQHAGWQDGLAACDLIAADIVAASELSKVGNLIIFRLVAEDFISEICEYVTAYKPFPHTKKRPSLPA